jgi:hypothetical protein
MDPGRGDSPQDGAARLAAAQAFEVQAQWFER